MDEITVAILKDLQSGGGILSHGTHIQVAPVWDGCDWSAYDIDAATLNQLYLGGLITEHYNRDTFQFEFYDISDAGKLLIGTVM